MKPLTRYSIGIQVSDDEKRIMKLQVKELKRKFKYTRNDVIRVVALRLLSDDDFIEFIQTKGYLKVKEIKSRRRKR